MPDRPASLPGEIPDDRTAYYQLGGGARLRYAVCEPQETPRGTFLILQGRREFIEKKYLEVGRGLLERGFRVVFVDLRNQGLATRFLDGALRQRDHVQDFNVYIEDLHAFYRDVVKPRQTGPLVACAHSIGGLIVTRWLAESTGADAPAVKAVIMTSPALTIGVPPLSHAISSALVKFGRGDHYATGQHDYNERDRKFDHNVLSHDPVRFAVIEKYFDANPELKVGGVSWDWLATTLKSIEHLRQPGYIECIGMPVLALFGGRDIVTPPVKIIPLIRRMPNAEIVIIAGALHDLMNEADRYRDEAWGYIDLFLSRVIRG